MISPHHSGLDSVRTTVGNNSVTSFSRIQAKDMPNDKISQSAIQYDFSTVLIDDPNGVIMDEYSIDGSTQLVLVTTIYDPYGLEWILVLVIPKNDYYYGVAEALQTTIIITVSLTAFNLLLRLAVWIVTFLRGRKTKTPVEELKTVQPTTVTIV